MESRKECAECLFLKRCHRAIEYDSDICKTNRRYDYDKKYNKAEKYERKSESKIYWVRYWERNRHSKAKEDIYIADNVQQIRDLIGSGHILGLCEIYSLLLKRRR